MRTTLAAAAVLAALAACNPGPAEDGPVEASAVAVVDTVVLEADAVDAAAEDTSATELVYTGDDDSAVTATVTEDQSYRIEEGGRTYYYRRGEDDPYLVREQGRTYAFSGGHLESAVDAQGRALSRADRQGVESDATRWADRGRQLKAAVQPRQAAATARAPATSVTREERPAVSPEPARTTGAAPEGQRRTGADGKETAPDDAGTRRDRVGQPSRENEEGDRR